MPCTDLTNRTETARDDWLGIHHQLRPYPPSLVSDPLRRGWPTMFSVGRSPRRGWKCWTFGNRGIPHFQEAAGSHFQPIRRKCKEFRKAATSRFPRPLPCTLRRHRPVERCGCFIGNWANSNDRACRSLSSGRTGLVGRHPSLRPTIPNGGLADGLHPGEHEDASLQSVHAAIPNDH